MILKQVILCVHDLLYTHSVLHVYMIKNSHSLCVVFTTQISMCMIKKTGLSLCDIIYYTVLHVYD